MHAFSSPVQTDMLMPFYVLIVGDQEDSLSKSPDLFQLILEPLEEGGEGSHQNMPVSKPAQEEGKTGCSQL